LSVSYSRSHGWRLGYRGIDRVDDNEYKILVADVAILYRFNKHLRFPTNTSGNEVLDLQFIWYKLVDKTGDTYTPKKNRKIKI
jgi:hypothetical protein